ncbi:aminotransferase, class I/II [[Eubacterium] yurii subsp. margaretiae ATCC 43715]|nr:aminotransferase, class I/II [[Eubacterium] yurii subsp. margaretiae ATCC 43715]
MNISKRTDSMPYSSVRKLVPYEKEAVKQGKTVYHLNIGQPDIKTPQAFYQAMREFNQETLAYADSRGEKSLIDAVIKYYDNIDVPLCYEDIFITNGGSEGLLFAFFATMDEGDELLVPQPFYTNYNSVAKMAKIEIKPIVTLSEDGFKLPSYEEMKKLITPKTKAFLITNPNNPTGAVYSYEELRDICTLAKEHGLYILADEVYREFIYDDDVKHISLGTMEDVREHVIIIDSISKRYSACGARIGILATKNKDVQQMLMKLCQLRLAAPTLGQIGAAKLYQTPQSYLKEVNQEYKKRRDVCYECLSKIEGVFCKKPLGAFYMMATLPVEDAHDFCIWLLENFDVDGETLMMAPADGFYCNPEDGKREVRIAYVLDSEKLKKAFNILDKGLKAYKSRNN